MVGSRHSFTGRKIEPPKVSANMTVPDLIKFYGSTGYNARRLDDRLAATR